MKREIGDKLPSVWQDEQVVVFDCFQRLHGYKYISIIDLDEFLLPRKHKNIKEMMVNKAFLFFVLQDGTCTSTGLFV